MQEYKRLLRRATVSLALAFIKTAAVRSLEETRVKMEGNITDASKENEKLSACSIISAMHFDSKLDWIF